MGRTGAVARPGADVTSRRSACEVAAEHGDTTEYGSRNLVAPKTTVHLLRQGDAMEYRVGNEDTVGWIRDSTAGGLTIGAAIPPGFASYATIVIPEAPDSRTGHDRALLDVLRAHSTDSNWWLGFLNTGADPLPFPEIGTVPVYRNWQYLLVSAGREEALSLRKDVWVRTLPDLIFPNERTWLISTLWDDDWRCVGGPEPLIQDLVASQHLETRVVDRTQNATPPGHIAR